MLTGKRETILVAGCGRLGATLAGALSNQGYDVVVIDRDNDAFRKLPANFSGFEVLGDVTDLDILLEAGLKRAKIVAAVTDSDNVNCMVAQIASRLYAVGEVLARLNDTNNRRLLEGTNVRAIYPSLLALAEFQRLSSVELDLKDLRENP